MKRNWLHLAIRSRASTKVRDERNVNVVLLLNSAHGHDSEKTNTHAGIAY